MVERLKHNLYTGRHTENYLEFIASGDHDPEIDRP